MAQFKRRGSCQTDCCRAFSTIGIVLALFCLIIAGLLLMKASSMDAAAYSSACTLQTTAGSGLLTKNIEDVKAGDKVWAYDAVNNQWKVEPVIRPLVHDYVGDMVSISVAGQTITSTGNHPYWVAGGGGLFDREQAKDVYPSDRTSAVATGKGRWIEARKLQAGDMLVLRDGSRCPISEVQVSYAKQKVYNLQVADLHTYAVSDVGVAVHNKPCFPPGTLILMGDGSVKPIEQVELGDQVMAGDPLSAVPPRAERVTGIIRDFAAHLVDVKFITSSGTTATISSTRFHPFWTNNRGWVDARGLEAGDELQDSERGSAVITQAKVRSHFGRSYNLEVAHVHTYYALADNRTALLVHNQVMPKMPLGGTINVDPLEVNFSHPNVSPGSVFSNGPLAGQTVQQAADTILANNGVLPDGLSLNVCPYNDGALFVAENNRSLLALQLSNTPSVPATIVGNSAIQTQMSGGTGNYIPPDQLPYRLAGSE